MTVFLIRLGVMIIHLAQLTSFLHFMLAKRATIASLLIRHQGIQQVRQTDEVRGTICCTLTLKSEF